jgi:hypothetical protein
MNKLVASVGLVALGASSLQAAVPGFSADSPKPWSVSASLRGFYDDNINTLPDNSADKQAVWGYEVSPSVALAWSLPQTDMSFSYVYSLKYYDHTPLGSSDKYDSSHIFNASLDHAFSERYKISVKDSFVIGQEPDLIRAENTLSTFQRVPGDNIRNYGVINFDAQLTPVIGLQAGYANAYYNYSDSGVTTDIFGNTVPSLSGLLDRIEHAAHLDSRWTITPETIGIFGYEYREVDYIGDELLGTTDTGDDVFSKDRNSRSHRIYVGVDETFRPDLTGALRAGGQYVDYYNDPNGLGSGWAPYVKASLRWTYAPESYLEGGVTYDINATDVISFSGNEFTQDAESTVVYASLNHRIAPKLYGAVTAQFQNSTWRGGAIDGETEQYYLAGINLKYLITPHFSTEIGYNYDKLESDLPGRSFDRNRVYIGVAATY